jgi:uncharacterized protein YdbL (DUF1318 family)
MGDSQSTTTGNHIVGKIDDALKVDPQTRVYGHSLYAGAGNTTQDAWHQAAGYANGSGGNQLQQGVNSAQDYFNNSLQNGGLTSGQSSAMSATHGLYGGYAGIGDNGGLTNGQQNANHLVAGSVAAYRNLGDNGGLTGTQQNQQGRLGDVAQGYRSISDHNGLAPGQQGQINTATGIAGQYGNLTDHNGLTTGQGRDVAQLGGIQSGYSGLSGAYDQNAPGYSGSSATSFSNDTLSSVNSMFGGSGRLGSGLNYSSAAEGVGNALAGLDYGNYQNNVANQYQVRSTRNRG